MARRYRIPAVALVAALVLFALLPPGTTRTDLPPASTVRGAFHIHSSRSDGSGSVDEIAAAAARAGLQFIILTDHGDATRPPDPPSYRSGVLTIDGVELNTTGGHYAVIGLPASPYPLAGAPAGVIEDVHRLGGFGFAAHPGSPRESLTWQEWDSSIDGLEWLNGDSEWRDEPRLPLARALLTYLLRAPESMGTLLDRPDNVIRRWDALAATRTIVGIAGSDAHARLGVRQRTDPDAAPMHVRWPGYEASFRAFSNHVALDGPLLGQAETDAGRIVEAIRRGHLYSVIDALATPGSLTFSATSGSRAAQIGDRLPIEGDVLLHASAIAPPGTTLVLLRDGRRVHEVTDGALEANGGKDRGVYRVEAYTRNAPGTPAVPWIVSNPIYAGAVPTRDAGSSPEPLSRIPARLGEVAAESGPRDTSVVQPELQQDPRERTFTGDPVVSWRFALAPGTPAGQFAAVSIPVSGSLAGFDRVRFRVSASRAMRVWVQLRAPVGNTERWGATFYADTEPRVVDIAFPAFAALGATSSPRPPLDRVDSLLFVVDTLNALPGTSGSLAIADVGFVK